MNSVSNFPNSFGVSGVRKGEKASTVIAMEHDVVMEAIGEEFPTVESVKPQETQAHLNYKVFHGPGH